MVWSRAAFLVLLLAFLPAPAAAQGTGHLLEDDAKDVQIIAGGAQAVPDSGNVYTCADLVAFDIAEARSDMTFTLTLDDLKDPGQDPAADGCRYQAYFTHNGREFRLTYYRTLPMLPGTPFVNLFYRDSAEVDWSGLWSTDSDARWDLEADTYAVTVPRDVLADPDGAAPFPGRSLAGIRVEALSSFGGATIFASSLPAVPWPAYAFDQMPDDASQAGTFPVQVGVPQTGHARLSSPMPFRASNGEATTFVYNVTARNLGEAADTFELSASGVPSGYSLVLPVPVVKLEGGAQTAVPVLLSMPFGHQHGALASFILEMHSLTDTGSVGRLEMGIRFLQVPQPAGHHDTVYLHSFPAEDAIGPFLAFQDGYFNTVEQDPEDAAANLYSTGFSMYGLGEWGAFWTFRLSPALEMGLDIDPAKVGTFRVPIGTTLPITQARVSASLSVSQGDPFFGETTDLATAGPSDPVDIGPAGQALIEAPLVPVEGGLRVPFKHGQNLWLQVELRFMGGNSFGLAQESVYLAPGGSALLPLREWHDAVDEALAVQGGPALSALGAQERLVNPGEAVVFPVSVANPLDDAVTVALEVSGAHAEWASMPADQLTVPAHGTAQVSVVVRAPAGAVDQERADLVLQAYAKDRPEVRGLLRLVAEVDTAADQVDDTAVATDLERKESPAPGTMLVVLGLAGLAGLLRRRD